MRNLAACALALYLLLTAIPAPAAVLDDENQRTVTLADGTSVTLFGEAGPRGARTNRYYYLPTNLRLSRKSDGTPDFLFLKYTTDQAAGSGGVQGAVMHLLMEWGLTPSQEEELRGRLHELERGARLLGAVRMEAEDEAASFSIVSATLGDSGLAPVVVHSDAAPLLPSSRVAAAARLSGQGAQLMAASFERARSIADLSIELRFRYTTLTPAAKGSITIDWSRIEEESDELTTAYSRTQECSFWSGCDAPVFSDSEVRRQLSFLEERKMVVVEFQETLADERVNKIREAFFEYFVDALAERSDPAKAPPPSAGDEEEGEAVDRRQGGEYSFSRTRFKRAVERGKQVLQLQYGLAVKYPYSLVGNLGEWYDGVRDNPRCVAAVNLDDPFFQHRDIHFVLDMDARDLFDELVSYVTVDVAKERPAGRPFEGRVTFTGETVAKEGVTQRLTYARGEGPEADGYRYRVQWSLKGGDLFPPKARWQEGSWQGVTLSPPVVARTLELEADLADLEASEVARVTAQVRFERFGREEEVNLHVSPGAGQPLVAKRIFVDRDQRGYAYRLIVNHKRLGKLVLPWNAKVGDDYLYATLPAELFEDGSPAQRQARESSAEADGAGGVLERFRGLLEGGEG